jgi:Ala-tRNA(Pro) deacylase
MPIAKTVLNHLDENEVAFEWLLHPHTDTSQETAEATHVSGDRLAKGVVLRNEDGKYILAVLPASRVVHYPEIEAHCGSRVQNAGHDVLKQLFPDCEIGAVPPFGTLYDLPTVVDEALFDREPVYFESGDHESIVCVSTMDFRSLLFGAHFLAFSEKPHQSHP